MRNLGLLLLSLIVVGDTMASRLSAFSLTQTASVECPTWCDSEFVDVVGKAENPDATAEEVRLMLQTFLADRFKLTVRREKQETAGYALMVGKNGSKLKVARTDQTIGATTSGYLRTFQRMPLAGLVNFLAGAARQPVIDETGLRGAFDFTLDHTTGRRSGAGGSARRNTSGRRSYEWLWADRRCPRE